MASYLQDDKKPSVAHVEHGQGGPDYMDDDGHMNKQFETDARGGSLGPIDEVASKALTRKVSDQLMRGCRHGDILDLRLRTRRWIDMWCLSSPFSTCSLLSIVPISVSSKCMQDWQASDSLIVVGFSTLQEMPRLPAWKRIWDSVVTTITRYSVCSTSAT